MPMADISELRLVRGVTPELFALLQPYVTVLPLPTLINVNSAPVPVLHMLAPGLSVEGAKTIASLRQFDTLERFSNLDVVRNLAFPTNRITISSEYFLVKTKANQVSILTLMQRRMQKGQVILSVLWQTRGNS